MHDSESKEQACTSPSMSFQIVQAEEVWLRCQRYKAHRQQELRNVNQLCFYIILHMICKLVNLYLLNLYVSFSAINLSPISNVGYMDKEGMNRGSAMNLHEGRQTKGS
jgi:hypothetical protein